MKKKLPLFNAGFSGGSWALWYVRDGKLDDVTIDVHPEYLQFLKDTGIDWIGFSVSVFLDSDGDSTVRMIYDNGYGGHHTITEANFKYLMKQFSDAGLKTYVTVAFEDGPRDSPRRWLLGADYDAAKYEGVNKHAWYWDTDHPQHDEKVAEFWHSYTDAFTKVAKLSQKCGVDMLSLGTEIDGVMTTDTNEVFKESYRSEIEHLISKTKDVYHGLLTYNQLHDVLTDDYYTGQNLWHDVGLNIIGVSAYFKLLKHVDGVSTVKELEAAWRRVFDKYLEPLQEKNPNKSIIFTEFGFSDSVKAPVQYNAQEFKHFKLSDKDHNGLDDGQETQANIYQAFFNVNRDHHSLVRGFYLWDVGQQMVGNKDFHEYGNYRSLSVRGHLAEDVVKDEYTLRSAGIEGQVTFFDGKATADAHGKVAPEYFASTSERQFFRGGTGDDTYRISHKDVFVRENGGEGSDTVEICLAEKGGVYRLGDNIEKAVLVNAVDYDLVGNESDNVLEGNNFRNVLNGLGGNDVLVGHGGADIFMLAEGAGTDTVLDFRQSDGDKIDLSNAKSIASFEDVKSHALQDGKNLLITADDQSVLILHDVTISSLEAGDFVF